MRLLTRDERPALTAGQPLIWTCTAGDGNGRAGLRQQARQLLSELLSCYLGQPASRLGLVFAAGQPPRLAARWQGLSLSLSLSYCGELALVGLCPGTRIGIDLASVSLLPDWAGVARLYLGPQVSSRLARLETDTRARQFALAWAGMEASSKCLGLALEEWSAGRQQRLDACQLSVSRVRWPAVPDGAEWAWALARGPRTDR